MNDQHSSWFASVPSSELYPWQRTTPVPNELTHTVRNATNAIFILKYYVYIIYVYVGSSKNLLSTERRGKYKLYKD